MANALHDVWKHDDAQRLLVVRDLPESEQVIGSAIFVIARLTHSADELHAPAALFAVETYLRKGNQQTVYCNSREALKLALLKAVDENLYTAIGGEIVLCPTATPNDLKALAVALAVWRAKDGEAVPGLRYLDHRQLVDLAAGRWPAPLVDGWQRVARAMAKSDADEKADTPASDERVVHVCIDFYPNVVPPPDDVRAGFYANIPSELAQATVSDFRPPQDHR